MRRAAVVLALMSVAANPPELVLRLAAVSPEGSPWSNNIRVAARQIEEATSGRVHIKVYFGGVAGDEMEQRERLARGQLDAVIATVSCDSAAPSTRILRFPGTFQTRDEALDVMNRLQPTFEQEAHQAGLVLPGTGAMGADLFFTRVPVHSLAELRKLRLWRWDIDEVGIAAARAMGLDIVPLPVHEAARAFDEGKLDGFIAIPPAALVFQWSTRARYVLDLRASYVCACALVREPSFYRLPTAAQASVREAIAAMRVRNEEDMRRVEDALVGGLFQKQGLTVVPVSAVFRDQFFAAARAARAQLTGRYVAPALVERVMGLLADHRAESRH